MIEKCYWEEGSKQQWTFYANDNSSLDSLSEKLIIDDVMRMTIVLWIAFQKN